MSQNSKIEWTDHTFNPWWGCAKVSPACKNCYAERLADRFGKGEWTPGGDRPPASEATWATPLKWNRDAASAGVRARVFCASMADVFEDRADLDPLRERLWSLIAATPYLDWLLLTKRPDVMARWAETHPWPVNAWAGATVEDQRRADERIPVLLRVPARVRFLSCEPLLGALRLFWDQDATDPRIAVGNTISTHATGTEPTDDYDISAESGIHWVIAGGESGPGARPSHPDWLRSLRDQCAAADVPFHFKQWGEFAPSGDGFGTNVRRVGKHAAGRLLDGIEHNDYPKETP